MAELVHQIEPYSENCWEFEWQEGEISKGVVVCKKPHEPGDKIEIKWNEDENKFYEV